MSTRKLETLNWHSDLKFVSFLSKSCLIAEEELSARIREVAKAFDNSDSLITRAVTVRMMTLEWFLQDGEK